MKKLHALLVVIALAIVIISITIYLGMKNTDLSINNSNNAGSIEIKNSSIAISQELPSINEKSIALEQLAEHNTQESCWIVYKNKVYDLTDWLKRHPGGVNSIAKHCGTQGFEQAFTKKHGTSQSELFMKVAIYMGDLKEVSSA